MSTVRNVFARLRLPEQLPGLGAAVPTAFWWNDVARIARCGGNTLRVGHQPPFPEVFEACDRYGILLVVNSGDNEWALKDEPAITYKGSTTAM